MPSFSSLIRISNILSGWKCSSQSRAKKLVLLLSCNGSTIWWQHHPHDRAVRTGTCRGSSSRSSPPYPPIVPLGKAALSTGSATNTCPSPTSPPRTLSTYTSGTPPTTPHERYRYIGDQNAKSRICPNPNPNPANGETR